MTGSKGLTIMLLVPLGVSKSCCEEARSCDRSFVGVLINEWGL